MSKYIKLEDFKKVVNWCRDDIDTTPMREQGYKDALDTVSLILDAVNNNSYKSIKTIDVEEED